MARVEQKELMLPWQLTDAPTDTAPEALEATEVFRATGHEQKPPRPFSDVLADLLAEPEEPGQLTTQHLEAFAAYALSLKAAPVEEILQILKDPPIQVTLGRRFGQLEWKLQEGDSAVRQGLVAAGMGREEVDHLRVFGTYIEPLDWRLQPEAFRQAGTIIGDNIRRGYQEIFDGPAQYIHVHSPEGGVIFTR